VFHEVKGVSMGYGTRGSNGNAIGKRLALVLVKSAQELIEMGFQEPEIFELIGLFESGFGADRLSDMTIRIILDDLLNYSARITKQLNIKNVCKYNMGGKNYLIATGPDLRHPVIFLPQKFLRDLPVAFDRDQIGYVISTNQELRQRLNKMVGRVFKQKITKKDFKNAVFSSKDNIAVILDAYKHSKAVGYDFVTDPLGEARCYELARAFTEKDPLIIKQNEPRDNLVDVVNKIIINFKKNIENNGLNEHLFVDKRKPKPERASQLLFYAIADAYCEANNLDLSREPNAGSGPVDFKVSGGYYKRVLVEMKLSSNSNIIRGFTDQLPAYEQSEESFASFYVIIKVTERSNSIVSLQKLYDQRIKEGKKTPEIIIIDGLIKPTASKRKTDNV
jgi:hypothetical protein